MKSVVLQSHSTSAPAWILRCVETCKQWAEQCGRHHLLLDDRSFFEGVLTEMEPPSLPATDLARLLRARELIDSGCSEVVWVDSDVFFFDSAQIQIPGDAPYAFCDEVWPITQQGQLTYTRRINNCVFVFRETSDFLDFYIWIAERLWSSTKLRPRTIGTTLLTKLGQIHSFPLIRGIALLGPALLLELSACEPGPHVRSYASAIGAPIGAVNLTSSLHGSAVNGAYIDEHIFEAVMETLTRTGGTHLNRWYFEELFRSYGAER